jgi:nucleoid-associated protein YgaU
MVDAARFAAKPVKSDETTVAKPPVPAAAGTRRYVVQTGDTWADLSQAFYGSNQYWRHLADANQGVELTVGRQIVIPPRP